MEGVDGIEVPPYSLRDCVGILPFNLQEHRVSLHDVLQVLRRDRRAVVGQVVDLLEYVVEFPPVWCFGGYLYQLYFVVLELFHL